MTPHDLAATARARLQYEWEMNGPATNPTATIRRIAGAVAPRQPQVRREVEQLLHETWAQLCTEEGDAQ